MKTVNNRILQAIEETQRFIDKEGSRSADLRPADVQQHLDFCLSHIEKLKGMLQND